MATKSKKPETVTAIENPDEKRKALDTAISQIKKAKGIGNSDRFPDAGSGARYRRCSERTYRRNLRSGILR